MRYFTLVFHTSSSKSGVYFTLLAHFIASFQVLVYLWLVAAELIGQHRSYCKAKSWTQESESFCPRPANTHNLSHSVRC